MNSSIRSYFRNKILNVAGSFSKPNAGIHILCSHFASQSEPNYEIYCEFLQFLSVHCELVRIEDSVEQINRKTFTTDCLVSLTYDDGFDECYSIIAPALEEFKTNAAFFINGNFIGGDAKYKEDFTENIVKSPGKLAMNWTQITDLHNRGFIIGSHTLDHVNMNSRNYKLIDMQLAENKRQIEVNTNHPCEFFAYPFGQFRYINNETLGMAEKYHKFIFSGTNYKKYFSFDGRVLNRRHIESWWPKSHIRFFLSANMEY